MTASTALALTDDNNDAWEGVLKSVAEGSKVEDALLAHKFTSKDLELAVRNPAQAERWQEARVSALSRAWSVWARDSMMEFVGGGMKVDDAVVAVRGFADASFYELIVADPDMKLRFERAMEIRSLRGQQAILNEASDRTRDTLDTPKGPIPNGAAVLRSRLIVETQRELMGVWSPRYAPAVKNNVQVNVQVNHAEVLESARTREKLRGAPTGDKPCVTPLQMKSAIDAVFSEKPVPTRAEPPVWTDEPARDANTMRDEAARAVEAKPMDADALRAQAIEPDAETFGFDD